MESDWKHPQTTILVIELVDIPLDSIVGLLEDKENLPDALATNFLELWLVDYTGIDAYDNVELFCIYPDHLYGYYQRPFQKPYG